MTDFKRQLDQLVAKAREAEANEIMKRLLTRADALEDLVKEAMDKDDTDGAGFYSVLLEQILNICEIDVLPRIKMLRAEAEVTDGES